jgi:hypothetical protein
LSTTSLTPRVRVPRHVARLVTRLVIDYSASRRLVVDYSASDARPGASARRAARHAACRRLLRLCRASGCFGTLRGSSRRSRRLLRLAWARRRLLRLRHATGCLGTSRDSSRGSLRRSSSTTSPTLRVRVPRHVARLVTRLVAPLVVANSASRRLVVDYSASHRLVVDYSASAARPGASTRRAARHTTCC